MKNCTSCKQDKPFSDFNADRKAKDGYRHRCKECHKAWMKAYNARNAEDIRMKQKSRDAARPKGQRHGLTPEQYKTLVERYEGKCWSCRVREGKVLDHDHACCVGTYSCGKCVRGLLCHQCNTAFGLLQDSPEMVASLLRYALR